MNSLDWTPSDTSVGTTLRNAVTIRGFVASIFVAGGVQNYHGIAGETDGDTHN